MLKAAVKRCSMAEGVDWRAVAKLAGRTTKQCRERWMNVLDPSISRAEWSAEEIHTLFNTHAQLGNKWAAIAARLPGRPETAVKNTFYGAIRREERRAWAASSGQPIPPPFHAEVPHVPRVAAILAEMGLVLQPVSGGRKGTKASLTPLRKRAFSASSCDDGSSGLACGDADAATPTPVATPTPTPKRCATSEATRAPTPVVTPACERDDARGEPCAIGMSLRRKPKAPAAVTLAMPAPTPPRLAAWCSVGAAVDEWLADGDTVDLPSPFDMKPDRVCVFTDAGSCGTATVSGSVSLAGDDDDDVNDDDDAAGGKGGDGAWSLEFDVADHAALFGDDAAFAHPSERGMVDTDALFSPRAPREFSVPADFSWFVGL